MNDPMVPRLELKDGLECTPAGDWLDRDITNRMIGCQSAWSCWMRRTSSLSRGSVAASGAREIKIHPLVHLRFCRARSRCLRSSTGRSYQNKNAGLVGPA